MAAIGQLVVYWSRLLFPFSNFPRRRGLCPVAHWLPDRVTSRVGARSNRSAPKAVLRSHIVSRKDNFLRTWYELTLTT